MVRGLLRSDWGARELTKNRPTVTRAYKNGGRGSYRVPQGVLPLALTAEPRGEQLVRGATEHNPGWLGTLVALPILGEGGHTGGL